MTQFPIPKSKESYGGSQSPTFSTCLFPGFYSPSVADIIRLIKLPTHQTPISQWSTPRRKSFLYGIMIMASWQGIMWIWNPHSLRELTCTQIHSPYTPELFSEQIRHTAIQLAKSPQKQNWKKSQNSKPKTALRKRRLAKLGQFRGRLWGKVGIGSDTHPKKMRVA